MVYNETTEWLPWATQQTCRHLLFLLGGSNIEGSVQNSLITCFDFIKHHILYLLEKVPCLAHEYEYAQLTYKGLSF